jgi:SAM-dependent methyltransferase
MSTKIQDAVHRLSSVEASAHGLSCRNCGESLKHPVVDLGMSPLCENILLPGELNHPETFYPLRVFVCESCWLVQLHAHVHGVEIFDAKYAYLSSTSRSWVKHCKDYVESISRRLNLSKDSFVVEVACNDGCLVKNFVEMEIPCLGIEPATKTAEIARSAGVPVRCEYFDESLGKQLADEGMHADLMIGNNVLAHVPDLLSFLAGFRRLLKPSGTITFEFPHLLKLIHECQYDTIYQEHYCYYSLIAIQSILKKSGLRLYDVEVLTTHGGSLRAYVCHDASPQPTLPVVSEQLQLERHAGLDSLRAFESFSKRVSESKWQLLECLIELKRKGKRIAAYGAPGKGNTLLNYCGIREDLIDFTVDRNPLKQDTYLVGSKIPVYEPTAIDQFRPDYILVLPWNLRQEILEQMKHVRQWGCQFIIPIPHLEIL